MSHKSFIGFSSDSEYRIQSISGCRIVWGQVPAKDLAVILNAFESSMGDNVSVAMDLASEIGAALVIGSADNLEKLRENRAYLPRSDAKKREFETYASMSLPSEVTAWLLGGDRGLSSEALCRCFYGVPIEADGVRSFGHGKAHPEDPADLNRCIRFLRDTNSMALLPKAASLSPFWAALVPAWGDLESLLVSEIAVGTRAPHTYERLREILAPVERMVLEKNDSDTVFA